MGRLFNGVSSKIVVSGGAPIGIPATYALWFYSRHMPSSASAGILCGVGDVNTGALSFSVSGLAFVVNQQDIANLATSPSVIQPFRWNHAAVSYDQIQVKIYLNGDLISTTPATTAITARTKAFGQDLNGPQEFFSGGMSEAAIWSAVLNHNEIKRLAQGASPAAIRNGSLYVYYSMRGPMGANEPDLSGNGRTGTFTNIQPFGDPILVPPFWPGINALPLGWIRKVPSSPSPGMVFTPRSVGRGRRFGPYIPTGATPTIDRSHPLAQGLQGVWVPGITGATSFNLVDGAPMVLQDTTNTSRVGTARGAAWSFNGTGLSQGFTGVSGKTYLGNRADLTIFALVRIFSGAPGGIINGANFYGERAASGNDIVKLDFAYNSSSIDKVEFTYRNDAASLTQVRSSATPRDGLFHTWTATKKGNNATGNVLLYKDGVVDTVGDWAGTNDTMTDAGRTGTLGWDIADTTGNIFGDLAITACWSRVLTPAEVAQLSNDPWCFLKFPGEFSWIPKGVANTTAGMLWGPRRPAQVGGARSFNGSSDYIATNAGRNTLPISLSVWYNVSSFTGPGGAAGLIGPDNVGGLLFGFANTPSQIYRNGFALIATANTQGPTSTWTQTGVTYDGTNYAFYLNGKPDGSGTAASAITATNFLIGAGVGPSFFLTGSLADAAAWNAILTDAEMALLGRGYSPKLVRPTKIVGYWPLDGSSPPGKDFSYYSTTGQAVGTTLAAGPPPILKKGPNWPNIDSLFWIPQTTGAAPPPVTGGIGALLSTERSRLINAGLILS